MGNDLLLQTNPDKPLSLQIFSNAIAGYKTAQARAWAGALTLVLIVLALFVLARPLGGRRHDRSEPARHPTLRSGSCGPCGQDQRCHVFSTHECFDHDRAGCPKVRRGYLRPHYATHQSG
ncbi:MAG TPA: hypothetical protein VHX59_21380 [Mycobacteriales bacterium]|nr:hypothetical protein [Mycobacteriales bacterium]